mmetsp:Transcript_4357/g.17381  ORF Transcript_4357/g.17381 Transcript_4357/m.17381 type:complete len:836 (+) Transcript_4357:149-2656(+)
MSVTPFAAVPLCGRIESTSYRFITPFCDPTITFSPRASSKPVTHIAATASPFSRPMPRRPRPARVCCLNARKEMRLPRPAALRSINMGPAAHSFSFSGSHTSSSSSSSSATAAALVLSSSSVFTVAAGTTTIPATFAGNASPASSSSSPNTFVSSSFFFFASPALNAIALTPAAARPCGRIESESKCMTRPSTPPTITPSPLRTVPTCFSRSPARRSNAFLPLFRIATNSDAHVFLIRPRAVTITRCGSSFPPASDSSADETGSIAVIASPSANFKTRVKGVPIAVVEASGMVYARTACTRPRSVKNRTVSNPAQCVAFVTSSPPRILPIVFPRVARFCLENVFGSMRLMYPLCVMITNDSLFSISRVLLCFRANKSAACLARSDSDPPRRPSEVSSSLPSSPPRRRAAAASAAESSIIVLRSAPYASLSASASSITVCTIRFGSSRRFFKSATKLLSSFSSAVSLSRSRPVSRRRGIASVASACLSLSQKGASLSASAARFASGAARIAATTASGAACTARYPSTMCRRAEVFSSSNLVRRRTASFRNSRNSLSTSRSDRTLGSRPTNPTTFTETRVESFVRVYSCSRTNSASALLRSSITTRMPSRSDSSLTSATPSTARAFTKSAICSHSAALFVWYGMEEITIHSLCIFPAPPVLTVSMDVNPRSVTPPLPVRYISRNPPAGATISPPVGKSGAGITRNTSSSEHPSGFCAKTFSAAATSRMLCGGMLVAIPTAMPVLPLISKFGSRAGNTEGSFCDPSNVSTKSTASKAMSARNAASANPLKRHSVYRIAAGGSASRLPKLPWPSMSCADMEKSCAMRTSASYTLWSPCG